MHIQTYCRSEKNSFALTGRPIRRHRGTPCRRGCAPADWNRTVRVFVLARENRCGARGGHGKRRRMQEGEGVACDQCCSARWYGVAGDGQTATSTPSAARQRFVGIISYPPVGALSNSKSFLHGAMASLCVRPAYQCMCTCCTTVWSWHLFLKQLHGRWVSLNILSCTGRNEHLPFKFQLRRVYTNYNYGAQFYVAGVHARKRSMLCLMARSY
jgi:hypothetical protein